MCVACTHRVPPLTRVAAAAILDDALHPTRVLVAQRSYPDNLRGLWEFPGGKQHPGETALNAVTRECAEELGVAVTPMVEVPGPCADGWPLNDTAVLRLFTAAVGLGQVPQAGEDHIALTWMPVADRAAFLGLDWIPADLPIAHALLDHLE